MDRVGLRFWWRSLLFFDLTVANASKVPASGQFDIVVVTANDLQPEHVIGWLRFEAAKKLLQEDGYLMIIARLGGKVVGSCWLETQRAVFEIFDCSEDLTNETVYLTHLVTAPNMRGKGVAPALLAYAAQEVARMGRKRLVIACVPENTSVRRTNEKLAFRHYLTVRYIHFAVIGLYFTKFYCHSEEKWHLAFRKSSISFFTMD